MEVQLVFMSFGHLQGDSSCRGPNPFPLASSRPLRKFQISRSRNSVSDDAWWDSYAIVVGAIRVIAPIEARAIVIAFIV